MPLLEAFAIERAALLIQQAVDGVKRSHIRNNHAARTAFVIHLEALHWVTLCAWALVFLTFVERPLWCTQPEMKKKVDMPCENPMYPSYPINYLTPTWSFSVEALLLAPIAADNILVAFSHGRTWWGSITRNRILLLCIYAGDMLYGYNTPESAFRFAPYLRIGFATTYSHPTRRRLNLVVRTIPAMLSTFFLGFLYIAFFAWIGVILFPANTAEGAKYFNNLGGGMWSLLILLTTANYPDIMMPAYTEHREFVLFFAAFIILGVYFLVNMLTAVIFNVYQENRQARLAKLQRLRSQSLAQAYDLLLSNGRLEVPRLKELFRELNHYHDIAYIAQEDADTMASRVDADNNGDISRSEFASILEVLTEAIRTRPRQPWLERRFPQLSATPVWCSLKRATDGHWLDIFMDVFLLCTLGFSIAETWDSITGTRAGSGDPQKDSSWNLVEAIFCLIFAFEMCLKIAVLGWQAYWQRPRNKFDCIVTVVTTIVTVYVFLPDAYNNPDLIHCIAAFRVLRVLRLLTIVPAYRVIINTFLRVLPDAVAMSQVLFCAMYVFSVLGLQIFGGVINTDPASKYSAAVAASDFGTNGYYANNFNDMPSAMVLLFELLLVNNWFVLASGFAAACGLWARLYFASFYIFGVIICLNIVVAFILDGFIAEYKSGAGDERPEVGEQVASQSDPTPERPSSA